MTWDEKKTKILLLVSMIKTFRDRVESIQPEEYYSDADTLIDEYLRILEMCSEIDPEAPKTLLHPAQISTIDDLRYATYQLANYITVMAIPTFLELMSTMREAGLLKMKDSLSPLMPMLQEWNLSINWAIGAVALALFEVILNRKLTELGLEKIGSFEDRVRRLSAIAKERYGIQLPDLLASPFYKARNKVVHEGKEPTSEELDIIIDYLRLYSNALSKLKKNKGNMRCD